MSNTNEAFIKVYRTDTAAAAAGRPAHLRPATAAACRASVEIVSPDYVPDAAAIGRERYSTTSSSETPPTARRPINGARIGKQPLSTFLRDRTEPADRTAAVFTPQMTISGFHWPRVCRALWNDYCGQFDRVAEQLLARCQDRPMLVGVAGLRAGDGCTTTAMCLAMGLAAHEARVILVDANFAAPRLAHRLGVEPTTTWQEVLARGVPVAEAVIRAANDHVDLLPLGGHTYHAEHLAAGLQPAVTAGVLRHAYQIALVDLGAVLDDESFATADQLIGNMQIDAAILVTDAHRADSGELAAAGELLRESGCELLGAIENRVAKTQAADTA